MLLKNSPDKNKSGKKAQAAMELMFIVTLILLTLFVFQKYITRGFVGRWKSSGDSFAHGRQYDPNSTLRCEYDFEFTQRWYDEDCYDADDCARDCKTIYGSPADCTGCITGCHDARCNQP